MIRSAFTLATAAILVASLAVDVAAQRTGSRIGKTATRYDTPETMALVSSCLAERQNGISRSILDTLPGSSEEFRIMRRNEGAVGICMNHERFVLDGKKLELTPRALRPSLGVAVARQMIVANGGKVAVRSTDKPWFADAYSAAPDRNSLDLPLLALFEVGDCVVSVEATGAGELVMSLPRTPAENAAVRKLIPHLSGCIVSGQDIEITPETLRYAVAEPIVHRFEKGASVATKEAE